MLDIEVLPSGLLEVNCVILTNMDEKYSIVIDPGGNESEIFKLIKNKKSELKYILLTHAHFDHIMGLEPLLGLLNENERSQVEIYLHSGDQYLWEHADENARRFGIMMDSMSVKVTSWLSDEGSLQLSSTDVQVLHTPGHSPGSVCYYFSGQNLLVSGDTIFQGAIGRTDLWGGNFQQLIRSIESKLLILPGSTAVIPGHGPSTTIGLEKAENPFLNL